MKTSSCLRSLFTTAVCAAGLVSAALPSSAADVLENWNTHCASCHAKDGSGNTRMGKQSGVKDYRDAKVQGELKDDSALKALKEGIKDGGKEKMKPFKDKLTDDELKALVAHMRTFKK
jgi:cytochrome c553